MTDGPGSIVLAMAPRHFGSGHIIHKHLGSDYRRAYSATVEVEAVSLDGLLGREVGSVDFLHMDIEGAEPLALRGAEQLIDRSPNLKIVTEWSVEMMSARANVPEVVAWLANKKFRFWLIGPGGGLIEHESAALSSLPHCDLIISRNEPQ